jgi:predicted TIM-barrel fold metal-dependent hydrolase
MDMQHVNLQIAAQSDPENDAVPPGLPKIVDAHVHIFPAMIFNAVWNWFEQHAWPIRYKKRSGDLIQYLLSRGISHVVALQYAHKPGIARDLNRYMKGLCRQFAGRLTGMATLFPGEEESEAILKEAFEWGLSGVKLHAHVQCFDLNSPALDPIYDICERQDKPLVIHAGREPKSPAYKCDPYLLCSAEKLERVLKNFPRLRICVPHLGMDETSSYRKLIEKYDTLWLDTTMTLADFFPIDRVELNAMRKDRVMYGSDFPNIPYAWDREIRRLMQHRLPEESLTRILAENAVEMFGISMPR